MRARGRPILLVVALIVAIPVAVLAMLLLLMDYGYRQRPQQQIDRLAAEARATPPIYLRERELLLADPFFHQQLPDREVSDFIRTLPCNIDEPTAAKLRNKDTPWAVHAKEADRPRADTKWMKDLLEFGRWEDTGAKNQSWRCSFTFWAKLRLLDGLEEGNPAQAAREVRRLAWLSISTEDASNLFDAIRILEFERDAYDAHVAAGGSPEGWAPMSREQLERLRVVAHAARGFASPFVDEEVRAAVFVPSRADPLACSALSDAQMEARLLRGFGEGEFAEYHRWMEAWLKSPSPCRLRAGAYPSLSAEDELSLPLPLEGVCRVFRGFCNYLARVHRVAGSPDLGGLMRWSSGGTPDGGF